MIDNIAGNTPEDYFAIAERLSDSDVDMIEMNISCPNVKQGGVQFGTSCENAAGITAKVRRVCKKPLMVKLSPNVADIGEIAAAVEAAGADAISHHPKQHRRPFGPGGVPGCSAHGVAGI